MYLFVQECKITSVQSRTKFLPRRKTKPLVKYKWPISKAIKTMLSSVIFLISAKALKPVRAPRVLLGFKVLSRLKRSRDQNKTCRKFAQKPCRNCHVKMWAHFCSVSTEQGQKSLQGKYGSQYVSKNETKKIWSSVVFCLVRSNELTSL